MEMKKINAIQEMLKKIYGDEKGKVAYDKILPSINAFPAKTKKLEQYFSQEDVILITYADSLHDRDKTALVSLHEFANKYFKGVFSTIHLLPFYPFSSDDGFSVIDFCSVDSDVGTWENVNQLSDDFNIMFDLVLNHISAKSEWFSKYLQAKEGFENLAIEVDPATDLSMVTRPRSLPLLTEFKKSSGEIVHVWTTFSADQIDLNFESVDTLKKMIEVLLFYVRHGATILRLDAIAYLWKEIGTNCVHLRQTHDIVKLFRLILDIAAPDVIILTETNVPHDENISYFGNGKDEAQMIYNFTLPPMLFYSFAKQDATALSQWATGLELKSESNTFFNFTASHDGIGVRPLEGILDKEEINYLVEIVKENGGAVSYKRNADGSESPYEMNITYVDALLDKNDNERHADRFLASQAIQLVLPGTPAIYIHSILGSHNWDEGVKQTQRARTINREKLQIDDILAQLQDPESFRSKIFFPYIELIKTRKKQPAFHPNASFEIMNLNPKVFAISRHSEQQKIYAITNISSQTISSISLPNCKHSKMRDIITDKVFDTSSLQLNPYQFVWLETSN